VADWLASWDKVVPGRKVYLLVGSVGAVVDLLVAVVTAKADHQINLRPPLSYDDLSTLVGVGTESQVLIVRGVESMSDDDWSLIDLYLTAHKAPGQSLVLTGTAVPDTDQAKAVKVKAGRQGTYLSVADPPGEVGRGNLIRWVSETFHIVEVDAEYACKRAGYRIEPLFWARLPYLGMTGGLPMRDRRVRQIIDIVVPMSEVESVYRNFLARRRTPAALSADQARSLFKRLETALFDLSLIRPHLAGKPGPKQLASKAGLKPYRVIELKPLLVHYPNETVQRCRRALSVGFERLYQPEVVPTVSRLWGCR